MQVLETTEKIGAIWRSEEARIRAKAHPPEIPPLPAHPVGRYTDPGFFRLERDHLFNRVWLLVALANELPEYGSFKATEANGRPIVLVLDQKYFIDFGRESISESLPKVVRRIYHRYKRHKNILINLVNEVPELRATAENYSVDRLIYRASLIYLQIYEDSFAGKELRTVHGIMNLVYSAAIKQYLSDDDPPFGEDVFLDQLSNMMLGYLVYDEAAKGGPVLA